MNDAFGKRINEGDIVVYATRRSSSQYMHVGRVTKTTDDSIKVQVMASTSWGAAERLVTLRATGNVVVANGIDAMGMQAASK